LDKALSAHPCPKCGVALIDYYDEDTGLDLGARCENCGFKAWYMSERLQPILA